MNAVLWVCQVLLAIVFLGSGAAKLTMSPERMIATGQTGTAMFPLGVVRFAASTELLGAAGVTLPWLTGIAPYLTPAAAVGLGIVMIGAASAHVRLREPRSVAINGVLFAMCVFVAIGRLSG